VISEGEVDVWFERLDPPEDRVAELAGALSHDERTRAVRFYFERDRRRYVVARGLLRVILARYTDLAPERIAFRYGPRGKPSLATASAGLRFNLSHAADRALVGVTRGREIGVDLEYVRPMPELESLARRFFSEPERVALAALPRPRRLRAFFRCWTRKEAYIKAIGDGLACPLDGFAVSLAPGRYARLLAVEGDPEGPRRWTLCSLAPAAGFLGALAVEGRGFRVRRCR
jgi:4'-phosphopantetheinyl transferase